MEAVNILHRGLFFPSGRLDMREETSLIVLHHTGGSAGENPDAAEIVKEHVPALYYACGDYYNDTRVLPLVQAASVMSLGSDVIRRMDPFLRKVTI